MLTKERQLQPMSIVVALLWCVSEMTFQTELARHPGNDAHQMVLTPITK